MTLTECKERQWEVEFLLLNEIKQEIKNAIEGLEELENCDSRWSFENKIESIKNCLEDTLLLFGDTETY